MLCPNCGKEVPEGENNCPSCGVSLDEQNYGTSSISDEGQSYGIKDINNNKVENEEKSNKKKADILTLIAGALILCSILLLNYFGNISILRIITLVLTILGITILVYVHVKYPYKKNSKKTNCKLSVLELVQAIGIIFLLIMIIMILRIGQCMWVFNSTGGCDGCVNNCKNFPG